jgi:hypothetical protein
VRLVGWGWETHIRISLHVCVVENQQVMIDVGSNDQGEVEYF